MISKVIIILLFCAFIVLGTRYLFRSAKKISEQLRSIRKRMEATNDLKELESLYEELRIVHNSCWHNSMYNTVREIKYALETKHKTIRDAN